MKLIICFCLFYINFFCSFSQDNVFYVRNFGSKKNIDVPGNSKVEGEKIIQWSKNEGENQKWQLIKADDNSYYIKSISSGLFLDVPGGSTQSGIEVIQWSFHGGVNQKWIFKEEYDKKYKIISKVSGKHLQIKSNSASDGDKIIQTDLTNDDYSLWEFFDVSRKKANNYVTGTVNDVDGNTYKTVTIGTQTWMAENLRVSKYNNGTNILNITNDDKWLNTKLGACCYFKNDPKYNAEHGKLYNWYSLNKISNGNRNVCPYGWHVPTQNDFQILSDFSKVNTNDNLFKLVSDHAILNGKASGMRGGPGSFIDLDYSGHWWTSTESDMNGAFVFDVGFNSNLDSGVYDYFPKDWGLSVRCLKD